jgi:hypothetical protein
MLAAPWADEMVAEMVDSLGRQRDAKKVDEMVDMKEYEWVGQRAAK